MNKSTLSRQNGFTLVETLVALVVLAVGMLGIAGLYVEGLRLNRTAIYRTQAVELAADMAERIRANRGARSQPIYTGADVGTGPPDDPLACTNATCSPGELRDYDWAAWLAAIDERLPAGASAEITETLVDPPNPFSLIDYEIVIRWPETGQDDDVSFRLSFRH